MREPDQELGTTVHDNLMFALPSSSPLDQTMLRLPREPGGALAVTYQSLQACNCTLSGPGFRPRGPNPDLQCIDRAAFAIALSLACYDLRRQ
jgi:hypothetical protein